MGRYTIAHFCRFLTVLEYSPIGIKFSPTTALRALYTVKKKICCDMLDAGFTLFPSHSTYVLLICIFAMLLKETFSFSLNFFIFIEGADHLLQGIVCNIISLTTMRWYNVMYFCWFLIVLEYSPIGATFSSTTTPRTLYTVKKKKFENL